MTRRARLILLACVTLAIGIAAASVVLARSNGSSGNAAATSAYLRDSRRLYLAVRAGLPDARSEANSYVAGVVDECAGALSPPGGEPPKGKAEVVEGDIALEAYGAISSALLNGAWNAGGGRVKRLQRLRGTVRWQDQEADALQESLAGAEHAMLSLGPPSLCDDLREWAASGYHAEPAGTKSFLKRWSAIEPRVTDTMHERFSGLRVGEPAREALTRRLRRYENRAARRLRGDLARLRDRVGRSFLNAALDAEARMERGLGLQLPSLLASSEVNAVGHRPTGAGIAPPAAVRRAGGRKLREFYEGRQALVDSGCEACHRIDHYGNNGPGSSLTHVGSRLSEAQIRRAMRHPKAPMPSFKDMPKRKLDALVKFLTMLR